MLHTSSAHPTPRTPKYLTCDRTRGARPPDLRSRPSLRAHTPAPPLPQTGCRSETAAERVALRWGGGLASSHPSGASSAPRHPGPAATRAPLQRRTHLQLGPAGVARGGVRPVCGPRTPQHRDVQRQQQ